MKLLIIDDNKDLCDSLEEVLQSESFIIDSAYTGTDGIYKVCQNAYDLIILDLNLPDMNGVEVCEELRKRGKTLPILVLTVHTEVEHKIHLLNSFADDYLTKPFSFDELLARIRALLRRPKTLVDELLQIEDLTLNVGKQTVTRNGKDIPLTTKEFDILQYLMAHQGELISRATIIENIWHTDPDLFSKTLETHLSNLRKKINKDSDVELIQTIVGRGYMMG